MLEIPVNFLAWADRGAGAISNSHLPEKGDEFKKSPNKINKTKFFHPRPSSPPYPKPRPALGYT